MLYPGPSGEITAGGDKNDPIDHSHLNIQGYARGATSLPAGVKAGPESAIFPVELQRRGCIVNPILPMR